MLYFSDLTEFVPIFSYIQRSGDILNILFTFRVKLLYLTTIQKYYIGFSEKVQQTQKF